MRYINIGREVIPKHCKFGPRPAEGIVLKNYEWWSITDHLVKEQREKELAAVLKAKNEAKKDLSFEMTRNWSNTLASIKTQGNQKREEKMEKIKQDRIETYNQIVKNRAAERKKIMDDVKKVLFNQKDPVVTINSAVLFSEVLDERRKQIEEKNMLKEKAAKKEEEWVMKVRQDAQEEEKEKLEEKAKEKQKKNIQKLILDEQLADQRRRQAEKDLVEMEAEKQDLINMRIESEKVHHCNMVERDYRKKFTARYMKKSENQLDYERNVALEEIEENEINKIYIDYDRKFKKERREREERIKNEEIEKRVKRAEIMAQELAKAKMKEEDDILSAIIKKEKEAQKLEEEKEELRKLGVADLLKGKKEADEKRKKEFYERKEEKKWELMQQYRRSEINLKWKENKKKEKKDKQAEWVKELDLQCKELQEKREEEKRESQKLLENENQEKEELRQFCEEAVEFAKEQKLPDYPILRTIAKVKKENQIFDKKEIEEAQKQKEEMGNDCNRRRPRVMGAGCYCLKY